MADEQRLFEYVVTVGGERYIFRSPIGYDNLLEALQLERLTNANVDGVNWFSPPDGLPKVWFTAVQPNGKRRYLSRVCSDTHIGKVRSALRRHRFVIDGVDCLITRVY